MTQEIVVNFDLKDLENLKDCSAFIHNWQYPRYELPHKNEFGKFHFIDLIVRFHAHMDLIKQE